MSRAALTTLSALLVTTGCAQHTADDNTAPIVAGTLEQMTGDSRQPCVDSRTRGEPLEIFRTMMVAPDAARRPLFWRKPGAFSPTRGISGRMLTEAEFANRRIRVPIPEVVAEPLPMIDQVRLNGIAREASVMTAAVEMQISTPTPRVRLRWWPINRFDSSCGEIYTISRPVELKGVAFVSVKAGHRGTIYALERRGNIWVATAQWADWLY